MRVVAGALKGRRIAAPKGTSTRPTSDRVREALFSSLQSRLGSDLAGARVLDAYAGSGALGIEALSRGAVHATFVERDDAALRMIRENVRTLDLGEVAQVLATDARTLGRRGPVRGGPFTLLFVDPPYRIEQSEVRGLIESLSEAGALETGATIVWEHDTAVEIVWPPCVRPVSERAYGSTSVSIAECVRGTEV